MDTNRCRVLTKHLLRALPGFFDKLEMADCKAGEVTISFMPDVYKDEYISFSCNTDNLLSHYDEILDKAHLPNIDRIYATIPVIVHGNTNDVVIIMIESNKTEADVNIYTENRTELFISPEDLNRKLKCRLLGGAPTELICYEGHISYIAECIHPKCLIKQGSVRDLRS